MGLLWTYKKGHRLNKRVVDLVGMEGRILDILVRDVAALSIEDRSEAMVDASELRLDGGMG